MSMSFRDLVLDRLEMSGHDRIAEDGPNVVLEILGEMMRVVDGYLRAARIETKRCAAAWRVRSA
jgi:hypothetical protein